MAKVSQHSTQLERWGNWYELEVHPNGTMMWAAVSQQQDLPFKMELDQDEVPPV
jgi:hypothetical protein